MRPSVTIWHCGPGHCLSDPDRRPLLSTSLKKAGPIFIYLHWSRALRGLTTQYQYNNKLFKRIKSKSFVVNLSYVIGILETGGLIGEQYSYRYPRRRARVIKERKIQEPNSRKCHSVYLNGRWRSYITYCGTVTYCTITAPNSNYCSATY